MVCKQAPLADAACPADLPACIGSLGGTLRKLNVSENQLSYLPEGLGGLTALQTLRAGNNLLLELPDSLASLQGLTCLDLSLNRWEWDIDGRGNDSQWSGCCGSSGPPFSILMCR